MTKKTISKIIAILILTMMLLASFATISHADITESTNTGKITINGIESGAKVSIYQLTSVNYDYEENQPTPKTYTWNSEIKSWLDNGNDEYKTYANPKKFNNLDVGSETAKSFYDELAAAIKGSKINLEATASKNAEGKLEFPINANKMVDFTDCQMGTYLVLIENGYKVYTPSAVNLIPTFDDETQQWYLPENVDVKVKSTDPLIKKTVTNATSVKDNYSTSDTIDFTIETDIPTYLESSLSKKYTISDKLSDGLTLKSDSIHVYGVNGDSTIELTQNDQYTLTENTTNAKGVDATFLIDFMYSKINTYNKIKVTYSATLSQSALTKLGTDGNTNTAYLDYTNNPYINSDTENIKTQEASNTIYTYGIELTKKDKNDSTLLPGAKFTLSKDGAEIAFVEVSGVYYPAKEGDKNTTTILVTNEQGKLKIYGLDVGTYTLIETKAPNGYNTDNNPVTIVIKDDNLNGGLDAELKEDTSGKYTLDFLNTKFFQLSTTDEKEANEMETEDQKPKGFPLPKAGGMGTVVFVASGIVFIGIGITVLLTVIKRRK